MDDNDNDNSGPPTTGVMEDVSMDRQAANNNNSNSNRQFIRRQVSTIDAVHHKTGIFGASSNLVNSIVGAGIIGIPYAINEAGFVAGVALLCIVAYFTDKSLRMIVDLASFHPRLRNLGVLTFEDLMSIPFGKTGSNFILVSMFILSYGAMTCYLIVIADTVPTVLGLGGSFAAREVVLTVTTLVIILPLAMMRDISTLAFASFLSATADLVLVGIVMVYSPVQASVQAHGGFGRVVRDSWINHRLFVGLGVLSTAMACQHSAFLISNSLENNTPRRWAAVTGRSLTVASLMSILLGVFGYLGFLESTQGNVLNNFPTGSVAINGGRALLAITMYLTFPMESFVARHVIVQLLYNGNMDNSTVGPNGEQVPEAKFFFGLFGRREKVTFGLYVLALIPAMIVSDLGPVLSLTGSLGASCIAYIAPGLVYLGVNGGDFLDWASGSIRSAGNKHEPAASSGGGEVELPVVGDASASMMTQQQDRSSILLEGRKPWWWWPAGMPLWVAIASRGERGTREFLAEFLGVADPSSHPDGGGDDDGDDDGANDNVVVPNHRDYYISVVFIVFGVIAAVCGVVSNVYVQVNDIFFSPH